MAQSKQQPRKYSILEIVGALVALSGLLAALAWQLGKVYNNGYFSAYGVSSNLVGVSDYELTSQGAGVFALFLILSFLTIFFQVIILSNRKLFSKSIHYIGDHLFKHLTEKQKTSFSYYSMIVPFLILLIISTVFFVRDIIFALSPLSYLVLVIMLFLTMRLEFDRMNAVNPEEIKKFVWRQYPSIITIFPIILLYFFFMSWSYNDGYQAGCENLMGKNDIYTVYSVNPLPLENRVEVPDRKDIFEYTGYYGFIGNEYLILYNQISEENYLPVKTHFIKKSAISGFNVTTGAPSVTQVKDIIRRCQEIVKFKANTSFYFTNFELLRQ